jgi:hypothetical protein
MRFALSWKNAAASRQSSVHVKFSECPEFGFRKDSYNNPDIFRKYPSFSKNPQFFLSFQKKSHNICVVHKSLPVKML